MPGCFYLTTCSIFLFFYPLSYSISYIPVQGFETPLAEGMHKSASCKAAGTQCIVRKVDSGLKTVQVLITRQAFFIIKKTPYCVSFLQNQSITSPFRITYLHAAKCKPEISRNHAFVVSPG